MPYYPFYTYLDPGLRRRLSYGEYIRRRYRYRQFITRIPISIPEPSLTWDPGLSRPEQRQDPESVRAWTSQDHISNHEENQQELDSIPISSFTQTYDRAWTSQDPVFYSQDPVFYSQRSGDTTGSWLAQARTETGSTLKNVLYKTKVKINKELQFCPICQHDIKINTDIIRELECNHVYHMECIDKWLIIKNECPMCKNKI